MAIRAILIIFIIAISSPLQRKLGSVRTYQLGMATWPLSVIFLPVLNLMARSEDYGGNSLWFWLVFSAFYLCWGVGSLVWRKLISPYVGMVNMKNHPDSMYTGDNCGRVSEP